MATKVVYVSDLTGRQAEKDERLGRLVVLEHPEIAEPATLEVFPDEVGGVVRRSCLGDRRDRKRNHVVARVLKVTTTS